MPDRSPVPEDSTERTSLPHAFKVGDRVRVSSGFFAELQGCITRRTSPSRVEFVLDSLASGVRIEIEEVALELIECDESGAA